LIGGLTISLLNIAHIGCGPRLLAQVEKPSPIFSTRRRLFAIAVGAISYSGSILIDVRRRTFMCQHFAEIAVLNLRAA
jgi:hypothetical protein